MEENIFLIHGDKTLSRNTGPVVLNCYDTTYGCTHFLNFHNTEKIIISLSKRNLVEMGNQSTRQFPTRNYTYTRKLINTDLPSSSRPTHFAQTKRK